MPVLKHTHTYERFFRNEKPFYRCIDPDCTHFVDRDLVKGKNTLCTKCGEATLMDQRNTNLESPTCIACSKTKKGKKMRDIMEMMKPLIKAENKEESREPSY